MPARRTLIQNSSAKVTSVLAAFDVPLVERLIASQFPLWADLPVRPVDVSGWDNRMFRLGDALCVRLPSAAAYAAQVPKEMQWLPVLAPLLPLPIPQPLARGEPAHGYPYQWSVYRWLPGLPARRETIADEVAFARALGSFLCALRRIDASAGPPPGAHNFHRGGALAIYAADARAAIARLADRVDAMASLAVLDAALQSRWQAAPVWLHGDVAAGNLLTVDGALAAVIDFGCSAVGDPACDLVVAWTLLSAAGRAAFRSAIELDEQTWARARGWALWKAAITLAQYDTAAKPRAAEAAEVLALVLAEHAHSKGGC